ncbi:hypothetical protein ACOMHN_061118 [Nucella lapillus]
MTPVIESKRAALAKYKRSPSEKSLQALRAARSKVQQIARRCPNEYWQQLRDDIQTTAVTGNIRGMYEETPLMCNYDGTDNLKCLLGKDVIFDRNVSDDISLTRPPAGDKVGGQYVCQVAPPLANTDIVPCKLTFIDIPTEPPTIPEFDYLGAVADVFLLLIITAVIVVCVLFYIRRERIRKWCSGPIRQNWPGATGDPEELETAVKASAVEEGGSQGESLLAGDSPEDSVLQEIPQGLPQFFFKKGWTDGKARAEREMEAKKRADYSRNGKVWYSSGYQAKWQPKYQYSHQLKERQYDSILKDRDEHVQNPSYNRTSLPR